MPWWYGGGCVMWLWRIEILLKSQDHMWGIQNGQTKLVWACWKNGQRQLGQMAIPT